MSSCSIRYCSGGQSSIQNFDRTGKLEELVIRSNANSAPIVIIFDQNLSPAQIRSINAATGFKDY